MITITKTFEIDNGQAPYTIYTDSLAEVVITFRSENTVSLDLTYASEADISEFDNVTISDANGCIQTFPLGITNPSEGFYVSEIMKSGAVYTVSSNFDNLTYDWEFNRSLYQGVTNTNSIELTQYQGGPQEETLTVVVTNEFGAARTRTIQLTPCRAFARNESINLALVNNQYTGQTSLRASSSCSQDASVDWTTLELFDVGTLNVQQVNNGPNLTVTSKNLIADRVIRYRVTDTTGVPSNIATVSISASTNFGDVINSQLVSFPDEEDEIVLDFNTLDPFINKSSVFIISSLTNVPASINKNVLTIDATGVSTGQVGLGGNDLNGNALTPGVVAITRQLGAFIPTASVINKFCPVQSINLAIEDPSITQIVSATGTGVTISGTTLTLNTTIPTQQITAVVKNAAGQSSTLKINVCNSCQAVDVNVTVCDETITLYDYLVNPRPNGVWTNIGGNPVPATFDGPITLTTNQTYTYDYATVDVVPQSGFVCDSVQETVILTKVAPTNVANNLCTSPTSIGTISNGSSLIAGGTISENCSTRTTFSGSAGNQAATAYDQWFDVTSVSAGSGTLRITATVTGTGGTPLQMPKLQLWSNCATPLIGALTTTLNSATLVYEKPISGVEDFILQVLSDSTGGFNIQISQTTF